MGKELFERAGNNLRKFWGYESFRPGQDRAIKSVLDLRQTVVLFPTGGGKSLCYQVPATVFEGLTVVISPLVALMQDQVYQLNERGIPATFINSTLSGWEVEQRLVNARNGMYKLLYCAPERLKTGLWQQELPNLNIDLVAIDEAHCISEWGHDFRPSYREIPTSLESIADSTAWIALTATATPEVRDDIIQNLGFDEPVIVSKGFQRPNLKWWVVNSEKKDEKLIRSVGKAYRKGSGLIYGGTRKNCETLAEQLSQKFGIRVEAYHAGMDAVKRQQIQDQWVAGDIPLVVATNAFGMGIDKSDCRYVIHYLMPFSLESYYQEAGRAGRDGEPAYPVLLFKSSDEVTARKRITSSYPAFKELQKVYDALCDTLDLAVGSSMESAEEVSMDSMVKRSGLSVKVIRNALGVLDQMGILQLIEYVQPQIGIRFLVSADYMRSKIEEIGNQEKARFLDTLFRQAGSEAFSKMSYLDLRYLKDKLDVSRNSIIKGLSVLQNHDHLLVYEEIGNVPLAMLVDERTAKLSVDRKKLEMHRNMLIQKLERLTGYIKTDLCREVYIRKYFGERDPEPCGHCDNCMSRERGSVRNMGSEDILKLKKLLSGDARTFREIQEETRWRKEKLRYLLSYLMRENRVDETKEKFSWIN